MPYSSHIGGSGISFLSGAPTLQSKGSTKVGLHQLPGPSSQESTEELKGRGMVNVKKSLFKHLQGAFSLPFPCAHTCMQTCKPHSSAFLPIQLRTNARNCWRRANVFGEVHCKLPSSRLTVNCLGTLTSACPRWIMLLLRLAEVQEPDYFFNYSIISPLVPTPTHMLQQGMRSI